MSCYLNSALLLCVHRSLRCSAPPCPSGCLEGADAACALPWDVKQIHTYIQCLMFASLHLLSV
ncbi:hypothetical protein I7I50_07203 [Histoplasma capsulatum G186AR]|uniref:Uncharacterized protein n=1 Tax=Ajellomyces capsulatus TaxID=5037 RepID=A0A8H8D386_AJECA|nr:hypothetical protein I7I52_09725 [Histoplasma capsulatum]QSS67960.1 hypothetical protein I7I50_07203 [Histoplasma capsulatum G186AR]